MKKLTHIYVNEFNNGIIEQRAYSFILAYFYERLLANCCMTCHVCCSGGRDQVLSAAGEPGQVRVLSGRVLLSVRHGDGERDEHSRELP